MNDEAVVGRVTIPAITVDCICGKEHGVMKLDERDGRWYWRCPWCHCQYILTIHLKWEAEKP